MTVKELIEQLQKMPQGADVVMEDGFDFQWCWITKVMIEDNTVILA